MKPTVCAGKPTPLKCEPVLMAPALPKPETCAQLVTGAEGGVEVGDGWPAVVAVAVAVGWLVGLPPTVTVAVGWLGGLPPTVTVAVLLPALRNAVLSNAAMIALAPGNRDG